MTATFVPAALRVPPRSRSRNAHGRVAWAVLLAATLALKAFVPLLAAVSAQMQGKAVGDVCSVYGVRLAAAAPALAVPAPHHHGHDTSHAGHAGHAGHGDPVHADGAMAGPDATTPSTSHDGPPDHAEHARDHCALGALAVGAVLASAAWNVADWAGGAALPDAIGDAAPAHDAIARWLTLRVHAPPTRS
jgi:hypothetical protein